MRGQSNNSGETRMVYFRSAQKIGYSNRLVRLFSANYLRCVQEYGKYIISKE